MHILKKIGIWFAVLVAILGIASVLFAAQYAKTRPVRYADYIHEYADRYNVDPLLVIAVIKVESDFVPDAVSHMDARGLMQVLPRTAACQACLCTRQPRWSFFFYHMLLGGEKRQHPIKQAGSCHGHQQAFASAG